MDLLKTNKKLGFHRSKVNTTESKRKRLDVLSVLTYLSIRYT